MLRVEEAQQFIWQKPASEKQRRGDKRAKNKAQPVSQCLCCQPGWIPGRGMVGMQGRVSLGFTFADLIVVCRSLFTCKTWFCAHANLKSGTELLRHTGGLEAVSMSHHLLIIEGVGAALGQLR